MNWKIYNQDDRLGDEAPEFFEHENDALKRQEEIKEQLYEYFSKETIHSLKQYKASQKEIDEELEHLKKLVDKAIVVEEQ